MTVVENYFRKLIRRCLNEETVKLNNNFWSWFGDSKVEKGGKPLVVYHGTRSGFDVFKPSTSVGNQGETDQIEGMYFTDNKDGASFFALSDDEKFLKQVFLSIKNPYFVTDNNTLKKELSIPTLSEANKALKKMGYDGLIMERGFYARGGPHKLYLAFYPNQIKSVNNTGAWSTKNGNIYL